MRDEVAVAACSHAVFATPDVGRMLRFMSVVFGLEPRFANDEFAEIVLASGFRIAWFRAVGKAGEWFVEETSRDGMSLGLTVSDVDGVHARVEAAPAELGLALSGPPKDHPWGERSFLLVDPDGNRWEITQSVAADGMLPQKDFGA